MNIKCEVCGLWVDRNELNDHLSKLHPDRSQEPVIQDRSLWSVWGNDPPNASILPPLSASSKLRRAGDLVVNVFWVALVLSIIGAIILGFVYANAYKSVDSFGDESANAALGVGVAVGSFATSSLWLLPLFALGHIVRGQADIVDAITSQRDTPTVVA